MTAMILPGTYIEVRAEGLIAPGQVTVGNVGVAGTAAKGEVGKPILLSNYNDALSIFGPYDSFMDPDDPTKRRQDSLTLVRALELAFANGASTVYAMRVANAAAAATAVLASAGGPCVTLTAKSPGTWANGMSASATTPDAADVLMHEEARTVSHTESAATKITLHPASTASGRNRVSIRAVDGSVVVPAIVNAMPAAGEVQFSGADLNFHDLAEDSVVTVAYRVDPTLVAKVTIALGQAKETYLVTNGNTLVAAIADPESASALVQATAAVNVGQPLTAPQNLALKNGTNGAAGAIYGFDPLLDVDAHIIVAAGQDAKVGAALDAHCQKASTDTFKRDRIAVVGSAFAKANTAPLTTADIAAYVDALVGNTLASDRLVFIAPGFKATSSAAEDSAVNPITLPGSYTAAVIAGMLAALPPHVSLTNKAVAVQDVEVNFNNPQLTELVQNRVTALEVSRGIRVLRGQTTDDGAFREITTRRIVDYAKFGVRAAAGPYIGLLNNERVRSALRTTINSFLQGMLDDEMLVAYKIEVSATRDEQIKGIVQVALSLQPVFSINFIRVTMILS
jgi:hypothetical protein